MYKRQVDDIADALGVVLDDKANETRSKENRFISSESSKVKVMVIPTNEEVMIARDTIRVLDL